MKTLVLLLVLAVSAGAFAQDDVERARRTVEAARLAERLAFDWAWQMADAAAMPGMPMPGKLEKFTHCGIATSECPAVLSAQLKLTPGFGLVVDFVEPGSAAESAGLKQHDLLQKMNDQVLINPEQLRALVRMNRPSDDAKFTLLRQGQVMAINVELGQKEMPVDMDQPVPQPHGQIFIDPAPGAMLGGGGMIVTNINGAIQGTWGDDQTSIRLEIKDGKATHAVIRDNAGKELFNGPVETPEQRKSMPANLASKLELAERSMPANTNLTWEKAVTAPLVQTPLIVTSGADRPRVVSSIEKDMLMLVRLEKNKPTWVFAFNTADGKTLFDGSVQTAEQRKSLPSSVESRLQTVEKNQAAATDFGVMGR